MMMSSASARSHPRWRTTRPSGLWFAVWWRESGVGGMIESVSNDPLFEFDLKAVDIAWWLDIGQPGTRAVRQRWSAT